MTDGKRKFGWVDDWAKMMGERARIDAKVHKTAIVYKHEDGLGKGILRWYNPKNGFRRKQMWKNAGEGTDK